MSNDPLGWFVLLIAGVPALMMLAAVVSGFAKGIKEFWREGPR